MDEKQILKRAKAIQNVRFVNDKGLPLFIDLINCNSRELIELCLKTLKLDPNVKYDIKIITVGFNINIH